MMEEPECPVCLQVYDSAVAVPRVLPCGHSACEPCIAALPRRPNLPDTVRCPACNQIVRLPNAHSLPKNIDLLRLCSNNPTNPKPNPNPKLSPPPEFIPLPWTQHHLFDSWKHLILPPDSLSLTEPISTGRHWRFRDNQPANLLPLGAAASLAEPGSFRPSHAVRVIDALDRLGDGTREELGHVVEASSRQHRVLCRVYGLWMNPDAEESPLFLVSEKFDRGFPGELDSEERGNSGMDSDGMFRFGMAGVGLCEAVMGLHSQGVVCGCLALSSFCFDEFEHCLLDLNSVLLLSRRTRGDIGRAVSGRGCSDSDGGKARAFVSPEVFICAAANCGADGSVGYGSDVWSLACLLAMFLLGDALLSVELFEGFCRALSEGSCEHLAESTSREYEIWREKVVSKLEALLSGTPFDSLLVILTLCLDYHIETRPRLHEVWRCIGGLFVKSRVDGMVSSEKESFVCCLILGKLCSLCVENDNVSPREGVGSAPCNMSDVNLTGSSADRSQENVDAGLHGGGFKTVTLHGHQDCITGLAVGGGFLFSSSFDKTIHVWSMQKLLETIVPMLEKIAPHSVLKGRTHDALMC